MFKQFISLCIQRCDKADRSNQKRQANVATFNKSYLPLNIQAPPLIIKALPPQVLTVIPTVYLHTAASLQQSAHVRIQSGPPFYLVSLQVCVVATVDEVVGERLVHVLVDCVM